MTTFVILFNDARYAERWSVFLNKQLDPLVTLVTAAQNERTASLMALSGNPAAVAELQTARSATDASLGQIAVLAPEMGELHPDAVAKSNPAFAVLAPQAPLIRQGVDLRRATFPEVDAFYTQLAGVIAMGLEGLALYTPDSQVAAEQVSAADLMRMADLQSRALGLASGALMRSDDGQLRPEDRRDVAQLVGSYRNQVSALSARLTEGGTARMDALTSSREWQMIVRAEDELGLSGTLPMPLTDWQAAEKHVGTELLGIVKDHMGYANTLATQAAGRSSDRATWAGIGVATTTLIALALAVLQANLLVNRLRRLRSHSLELANNTLPSIVQRIHEGEEVDIDTETAMLDDHQDEIGQVAEAFGVAQRVAMTEAAAEARTRAGFNKVFLDIAYRSQVVVRRQMDVLDLAESKQEDPEHLELLFQLDHLATRARRNAENLLILGGGQPGRRWRESVSLEELVRSAVSETEDLTRVSAIRVPETRVVGNAVADLIHLLAELIENAQVYSPPQSLVSVHGNLVGRGVVVEVEDQGLGIRADERERLNSLLSNPPDFQQMALAGQRNLGLFVVAQLSGRHGITVSLQDSAYGGVKAIVLIPTTLLDPRGDDGSFDATTTGRHRTIEEFQAVTGRPVPRPNADRNLQLPPWPGTEPAAQPLTGSLELGELPGQHSDTGGGSGPHTRAGWRQRTPSRTRAPLPQRHRQTHLVPELRIDDEQRAVEPEGLAEVARPVDDIRSSMSSFQRGTRQGREAGPHDDY
ncbi:sensor histidine kinase [Nocardia jinanensis]|uniref:sensor histidine kinase n=1 Tax=Nocardia jinanensis TaxID=382504 RepID=UPI0007A4174E|nr:ATP-binding protein [Nocardia jinanensis]